MAKFRLTETAKEDVINSYEFGFYQFGEKQSNLRQCILPDPIIAQTT